VLFERWLTELAGADEEIFGEVMALLTTLEDTDAFRRRGCNAVAELLEMGQSEVSRLEYRTDMPLPRLRRVVHATGGDRQLVVPFPDGPPLSDSSPTSERPRYTTSFGARDPSSALVGQREVAPEPLADWPR